MVRHEVHGQNELCCPGFLASGSPPGQEERLVTSAGDAVKMPGHGRGPLGHGQASSNRTSTGPQPRSHPLLIGPRATKLSPQPAPAGMASTCALLLDLGRLEVGSRLTMNQGLQLRSSTSAAIRPARGSSEEVPQPPSAADPARGAQMAVEGPRGAQERFRPNRHQYQFFTTGFHFSQIPLSSERPYTRAHARPAASPAVPELSAYPCTPRDTALTKHSHNTAPAGHIGTD